MTPTVQTSETMIFAGRNGSFALGPSPGIKELWTTFMQDFGKIEGQLGLKAYGICHNFDGKGMMDYLAAVAVADEGQVPGYLFTLTIPKRKVAVFTHDGPLENISDTWNLIFSEGLPEANLKVAPGPQFEVYPEDLGVEGTKSKIEIHIPVI